MLRIKLFCCNCGKIITGQGRKFCSLSCSTSYYNKHTKVYTRKEKNLLHCLNCGGLIIGYGKKFCCLSCSGFYILNSEETKVKLRLARLTRPPHSVETREKIRQADLKLWSNKEWAREKQRQLRLAQHITPNKQETSLQNLLNEIFPNIWEFIGDGKIPIEGKHPDFYDGDHHLIELFGGYWHSEEVTGRTKEQEENERIEVFAKAGYFTLIIWEDELRDKITLSQKIRNWYGVRKLC